MAIHSVSEVNHFIKGLLDAEGSLQRIMVRGEISNFKTYRSGHCYFTLKDADAALKCVMFRSRAQYLSFVPQDGQQVVASGSVSVYERDGVYQLYANSLAPEGQGQLALALRQLRARLEAEGLFADGHKRPLPRFPKRIGVVTSLSGAVLRDIYHVSKRRNPSVQLVLLPVRVQGEGSAEEIAAAIRYFNRHYPVDVLIVGRGGGSMEDLWSFNEECIVRAIFASRIPVISAVGHETDFTLADEVSDVRAATPSQAAELAVPDRQEVLQHVLSLRTRLQQARQHGISLRSERLRHATERPFLQRPELLLATRVQALDLLAERLKRAAAVAADGKRQQLEATLDRLELLNPVRVLRRGYAVVEKDGHPLVRIAEAAVGDELSLRLADGRIEAEVRKIEGGTGYAKEKGTKL